MYRMAPVATALVCGIGLTSCGGGGDDGSPPAVPPPAAPVQLALDAVNYQGAVRNALEWGDSAFSYAKLGADVADRLLNTSLLFPPVFPCPVSGAASITHTDRNGNGMFNSNDTLHLFMDRCVMNATIVSGVVRVQIISAVPLGDGREFELFVEIVDLTLAASPSDVAPVIVNFSGSLDFSYTTDFDHYVLSFGQYRRTQAGETQSVSDVVIDYLQRYDTLRYDYLLQGTAVGASGQFRVSTPMSFSGTIGAYPNAGRLALSGAANSTARLAEEGAAAANSAAVLVSVDANGDGVADSEVPELAWTQLLQPAFFSPLRAQSQLALLPIP